MATVRLSREEIRTFVKHVLFGVPFEIYGSDLMVFSNQGDDGVVNRVIVENKDIFHARKWILGITKEHDVLKDFHEFWAKHLENLGKASNGTNG